MIAILQRHRFRERLQCWMSSECSSTPGVIVAKLKYPCGRREAENSGIPTSAAARQGTAAAFSGMDSVGDLGFLQCAACKYPASRNNSSIGPSSRIGMTCGCADTMLGGKQPAGKLRGPWRRTWPSAACPVHAGALAARATEAFFRRLSLRRCWHVYRRSTTRQRHPQACARQSLRVGIPPAMVDHSSGAVAGCDLPARAAGAGI
jgi:hypothetical protein